MKWCTNNVVFSLASMAAAVGAAALGARSDIVPSQLRVQTSEGDEMDGKLLTLRASEVGLYQGEGQSPLQVYKAPSSKPSAYTLHTYPIGIVDHALGLDCSAGSLCTIVDVMNTADGKNDTVDLNSWTIGDNGEVSQAREGHWVAKPSSDPGSYDLRWWDGSGVIIQIYLPVKIQLEPLDA